MFDDFLREKNQALMGRALVAGKNYWRFYSCGGSLRQ